ncbi:outer membrane beta-barrel protein [Aequorivita echinoideorum]|uniref:Outer membrane beta-barrel protein n=1 Tax=Aequorivita echinoideorum TaxID=1549647 RepID=A0ABS5S0E7_9FLAO|nr:outer membrane beta-barrel protein [Aequorivita echinoideorum]MBT0606688.1 outer membrane beta-barrel protein [Aequorivita echinoideorum]
MKKCILWLGFSFFPLFLFSQNFEIKGKLVDETENFPLESATIFAEKPADSSLITYTISGRDGEFELKGRTSITEINVNITYTGYASVRKKVTLNGSPIDLGTIKMPLQAESLGDVVITATRAPITIKKDTLEFNAASFSTKANATVEDLLKELPGVEVDAQGNITVNGKAVNKILVNGKPFFGDDPTIATRNLTKDIVDKIQVTETKTDSQAFSGEKGDDQNQTINITIDEEKNKGIFGRVAAGGGTDKRFEYAGLVNYFDNDLRLSALAGGNNINSPGFSFGEIEKMFGSARNLNFNRNGSFNFNGRSFGSAGEGITNSRTAGTNYADDWGKGTDISADYFYSAANSFNEELRNRENILPENRYFSTSDSRSEDESDTHSANIRFKTKIDSTFLVEVRPQFTFNKSTSDFTRNEESRSIANELINQSNTDNQSFREGNNFENELTATKNYGSRGGYFRVRVNNSINTTVNDDFRQSLTQIFGDDPATINRDQFIDGNQRSNNYAVIPSFRYPIIADTLFFYVGYNFVRDKRMDKRSVFDFNEQSQAYTDFNVDQSTDFENTNQFSKPQLSLTYNADKIYTGITVGYVSRRLESNDALRNVNFQNDFNALEMNANFRYRFSKKFSIYSGYSLNNNAPNINQLSPYVDVSDPLNITRGNPDLKPSNEHRLYFGGNNYDYQTQSGFYSYLNASLTNDRVVPQTIIDENFVRNTTYTNVDGNYNISGNLGYNKTTAIDSLRTFKYGAGFYIMGDRSVNFNNNVEYSSNTISYNPSVNFTFSWKDLFEITPSYRINYSTNSFDIDAFENRNYTRHEMNLRTKTFFPKFLEWNNDIEYAYNADVAEGFDRSYVFWNSSLVYSFLNDNGSATLKVYDLLNQNNNVRRTSTQDYIQDVQSTVLRQYFMFTLSYKFNTLGKKGEIRDNPWE